MGLFRSESVVPVSPGTTLEEKWKSYIQTESSRRLGWAIFQYDASCAYLHNSRPFLNFTDINLNLPGSNEHWEAENAEAWANLHPWSGEFPPTSPLRPKLGSFFDGSPDPVAGFEDEEHLFITVLMLLRMLFTIKEIRSFPLDDLAIPIMYEGGRQTLLHAIDKMIVPVVAMTDRYTNPELDRLVYRVLLVHVAHIYGASDLMNWLFPYLRNDTEKDDIKHRMRKWANEDLVRARDVTYHSAQILGLVRYYPSQKPLQSFLIFHAGVVLSCMSFLLPEGRSPRQASSIPLDNLGTNAMESSQQKQWVDNGTNVNLSLIGVPSLCCTTGRQQILDQTAAMLKQQKTWGIADSLAKVVISLSSRDA